MLLVLRNNTISSELQQQLAELTEKDAILLMADAVYLAATEALKSTVRVYVYRPDADARGIQALQLESVSGPALVDLTEQYSTWIKWE